MRTGTVRVVACHLQPPPVCATREERPSLKIHPCVDPRLSKVQLSNRMSC